MNEEHINKTEQAAPIIALGALAGAVAGLFVVGGFFLWFEPWLDQPSTWEALREKEASQAVVELQEEEAATIAIVEKVSSAVASVTIRKPSTALRGGPVIFFNGQPLGGSEPKSAREDGLVDVGSGTAFFVDAEGMLLTNRHVVEDESARYFITTWDGNEHEADVVARDTLYDVAVLRVKEGNVPEGGFSAAELALDEPLRIGQTVIAVGNALGEFKNTVTKGIISGINRDLVAGGGGGSERIQEAIQTDAAINPGNSGGPLINLQGNVIGINTAVSNRGSGLGFAIPISVGKKAVDDVREFGRIVRPWLGIRYVMLDDARAEEAGLPKLQRGAYIPPSEEADAPGVLPDSPAAEAGLREGDVIVKLNNRLLTEDDNLAALLNEYDPGDTVALDVLRDGTVLPVTVTLGEFDVDV